ncbi:hypothetical protein K458DRAFT_491851 [Lentithecium fluviatile CBS 122367]|uniref:Glyoxalase-like domain-containing protein n=1 Tax=Lentithecium fluviatile CBS 122367 TaxID=1168545 RepID=A0A6G1IHJ2_9PLEO|nr:hypothetical protein K458DRAFT_491851 [Lentithecium fluviatile CBS 122367]
MSTEDSKSTPPIPPQGAPCWIEVCSVDPSKLKEFYAAIFPAWKFSDGTNEASATPVVHITFEQPSGLSGGIVKLPEGCVRGEQPMGAGFTVYNFVKSIDETEKKILELGGQKVLDKMPEGKNGWFANFVDPEGNRFGVYEVNSGGCAGS